MTIRYRRPENDELRCGHQRKRAHRCTWDSELRRERRATTAARKHSAECEKFDTQVRDSESRPSIEPRRDEGSLSPSCAGRTNQNVLHPSRITRTCVRSMSFSGRYRCGLRGSGVSLHVSIFPTPCDESFRIELGTDNSSGQSVRMATRQLQTNATSCSCGRS